MSRRHLEEGEVASSSDEDSRRSDQYRRRHSRSRSPESRRPRSRGHASTGSSSSSSSRNRSNNKSQSNSSRNSSSSSSNQRSAHSSSSREPSSSSSSRSSGRHPSHSVSSSRDVGDRRPREEKQESRESISSSAVDGDDSEDSDDERAKDRLEAEMRAREERRLQRERRLRELAELGRKGPAPSDPGAPAASHAVPPQINGDTGAPPTPGTPVEAGTAGGASGGDDDDFDMFSASPGQVLRALKQKQPNDLAANGRAVDNFRDHEGYYLFRSGDVIGDRYQVYAMQGKGVFSSVLRVRDLRDQDRDLVVKVMRNNDTMRRAGEKELGFLKILAERDPDGRKHCVRMLDCFDHEGHMCVVFEPLHMNLREVLRKFGGIGLHISAVQSYARQLLVALQHIKNCRIVHGDIKPDNILVNEAMNVVKLCDFGSAGWADKCEITPYLVSRFYRPPEVIIGAPYDSQVDIWSVGCVLFELFTGKILFRGPDNNSVLQSMLELKGQMSKRMIRRGMVHGLHFDDSGAFLSRRLDPLTKQVLVKPVVYDPKPAHHMVDLLVRGGVEGSQAAEDRRKVAQLADLLDKMLMLDPSHRITVEKALQHPFFQ